MDVLFQYFVVVKLNDTNCHDNGVPAPYNEMMFPPDARPNKDDYTILIHQLKLFCFPDMFSFPRKSIKKSEKHFSFILTSVDGGKRFAYCARDLDMKKWGVGFCFITSFCDSVLFEAVLDRIMVIYKMADFPVGAVESFLTSLYEQVLSPQVEVIYENEKETFLGAHRDEIVFGYDKLEVLLGQMESFDLILVLIGLLMEKRIIFYSSNLQILSSCIQGFICLLNPFAWQHVYIPVLPPAMLDFACAPMPFILGILDEYLDTVLNMPLEEVLFVDLDEGQIYPDTAEYLKIPFSMVNNLASKIHTMAKTFKNKKPKPSGTHLSNFKVEEMHIKTLETAMHQFYSGFLKGYSNFFEEKEFDTEGFCSSIPNPALSDFVTTITASQLFNMFIFHRSENGYRNKFDFFLSQYTPNNTIIASESLIFKKGWLQKISGDGSLRWQERYFCLTQNNLSYRKKKGGEIAGSIDLNDVVEVQSNAEILEVITQNRIFQFRSPDTNEITSWFNLIDFITRNIGEDIRKINTTSLNAVQKKVNPLLNAARSLKKKKKEDLTREAENNPRVEKEEKKNYRELVGGVTPELASGFSFNLSFLDELNNKIEKGQISKRSESSNENYLSDKGGRKRQHRITFKGGQFVDVDYSHLDNSKETKRRSNSTAPNWNQISQFNSVYEVEDTTTETSPKRTRDAFSVSATTRKTSKKDFSTGFRKTRPSDAQKYSGIKFLTGSRPARPQAEAPLLEISEDTITSDETLATTTEESGSSDQSGDIVELDSLPPLIESPTITGRRPLPTPITAGGRLLPTPPN